MTLYCLVPIGACVRAAVSSCLSLFHIQNQQNWSGSALFTPVLIIYSDRVRVFEAPAVIFSDTHLVLFSTEAGSLLCCHDMLLIFPVPEETLYVSMVSFLSHFWIGCLNSLGSICCRASLFPGEIYGSHYPAAPCGLLRDIPSPLRALDALL